MELEFKRQEWTYRTLPNKMYELVHNTGDLNKHGTGYLTDAESEMLTILNYLNFGEKTSITESMITQIELAIKEAESQGLIQDEGGSTYYHAVASSMSVDDFVNQMTTVAKTPVCVVYFDSSKRIAAYTVVFHKPGSEARQKSFDTLAASREYIQQEGYSVRMRNKTSEVEVLETWI